MGEPIRPISSISKQALQRLPYYLQYLQLKKQEGLQTISAPMIAKDLKWNEVQIRKDLAAVSTTGGKPKTGFDIKTIIRDIQSFLGYDNVHEAVLVGAGKLGKALMAYPGFENYGIRIIAAFDNHPKVVGTAIQGQKVLPMEKLANLCRRMSIHIAIITVPAAQAQQVCDMLVEGGILAVWNFAPTHLSVPGHILVQNENMAASLALLSQHLVEAMKESPGESKG